MLKLSSFFPVKQEGVRGVGVGAKAMLRCLAQVSANWTWTRSERPVAVPAEGSKCPMKRSRLGGKAAARRGRCWRQPEDI